MRRQYKNIMNLLNFLFTQTLHDDKGDLIFFPSDQATGNLDTKKEMFPSYVSDM